MEIEKDAKKEVKMRPWHHHPSSRIYRVSRASGSKDRHSKVVTAKGLRDRRVRLAVSTAIQFYDLQDRLGYDQPSKAIEWLIKAAASAIDELPSLDTDFEINVEKPMACDSRTSEIGKGPRVKDKEEDRALDPSLNSQGSFTKLLAADASLGAGFSYPSGFSSHTQFGNGSAIGILPVISNASEHLAFLQGHFGDCNLDFSISSGLAGFHRGTLQSNSQYHHHQHSHHLVQAQRLPLALDGLSVPFFFGSAIVSPSENEQSHSGAPREREDLSETL